MSFLKVSNPVKRDLIVKEFLELKKNIQDNFLSERTGQQQLQTDLSKFYRPITETQKATVREITEGLKPIREGIENLPQAITFPPTQPIGEEKPLDLSEIAEKYLATPTHSRDTMFGIRKEGGLYYIGGKQATIVNNNIIIGDEKFEGTPGLWELIMTKNPVNFMNKDYNNYRSLMIKTNALHVGNKSGIDKPRSSKSYKWTTILSPIWYGQKKVEREGVVVI